MTLRYPAGHSHLRESLPKVPGESQHSDSSVVQTTFPDCGTTMIRRLGQEMSARRSYLMYRAQRHGKKSTRPTSPLIVEGIKETTAAIAQSAAPPRSRQGQRDESEASTEGVSPALQETNEPGLQALRMPEEATKDEPFTCSVCCDVVVFSGINAWK